MRFTNLETLTRYVDQQLSVLPPGWAIHRKLRSGRAHVPATDLMIGDLEWRIHRPGRTEDFADDLLFVAGDLSAFILAYGNRPEGRGWAPWYQSLLLYTSTLNVYPLHALIAHVIGHPEDYPLNAWPST